MLTEPPVAFDLSGATGGHGVSGGGTPPARSRLARQALASHFTDDPAQLAALGEAIEPDPQAHALARQIGARLRVRRPRRDPRRGAGPGEIGSLPYRGGGDEIDIESMLERIVEHPFPADEDIVVRDRLRTHRSVVLIVDVSGSMRGERVRTAAATVGALAAELASDEMAVVAFWSDAAIVHRLGEPVNASGVLDALLRIPARGLTNVTFALELAATQLGGRVAAPESRVLLLSDCVHNAGPDPRPVAARFSRLDVLLDTSGEHDLDLGRDLAARGKGLCRVVHSHRAVAPALEEIFAD